MQCCKGPQYFSHASAPLRERAAPGQHVPAFGFAALAAVGAAVTARLRRPHVTLVCQRGTASPGRVVTRVVHAPTQSCGETRHICSDELLMFACWKRRREHRRSAGDTPKDSAAHFAPAVSCALLDNVTPIPGTWKRSTAFVKRFTAPPAIRARAARTKFGPRLDELGGPC